jgi:hypothetical protein
MEKSRGRREASLLVRLNQCPEERPIPVNPVENGDEQENCHQLLLA